MKTAVTANGTELKVKKLVVYYMRLRYAFVIKRATLPTIVGYIIASTLMAA